ncbi:MAG: hypothetical protein WKF83_04670 [Nocardioidaceae bacterium]
MGAEHLDQLDELLVARRRPARACSSRPSPYWTNTWSQPLMSMFSTSGSSSSGCRRPTPNRAEWIADASVRLVLGSGWSATVGDLAPGVVLEDLHDQRAGVLTLVLARTSARCPVDLVAATLLVEPVGDLRRELAYEVVVVIDTLTSAAVDVRK